MNNQISHVKANRISFLLSARHMSYLLQYVSTKWNPEGTSPFGALEVRFRTRNRKGQGNSFQEIWQVFPSPLQMWIFLSSLKLCIVLNTMNCLHLFSINFVDKRVCLKLSQSWYSHGSKGGYPVFGYVQYKCLELYIRSRARGCVCSWFCRQCTVCQIL